MDKKTGEVREISLLDIMDGAVAERVNYEFGLVARNMLDLNTEAKKPRTLTIKITMVPADDRRSISVKADVSSKLVPVRQLDTTLLLGGSSDDPAVMEYTPQTPGQLNFSGGVQADPKIIQLAKRA